MTEGWEPRSPRILKKGSIVERLVIPRTIKEIIKEDI